MFRSEIYRSVVVVVLFWWAALTSYSVFTSSKNDWLEAFLSWEYVVFGIIFAPLLMSGIILLVIKNREYLVTSSSGVNMTSTIGSVPAWLKPPKLCPQNNLPKLPKRILEAIGNAGKKDPVYMDMAVALLRVLNANARLPASPYESGHGCDTLFNHTIKVALKTIIEAESFSYTGLFSTSGRLVVGLRESGYKFDPNDPLVLIAALAHDIGKIDAFISKKGKVVGIKPNHDTFSMLMLARMPEFNKLPFADGRALLGAVGYYHAPQTLPLDSARRAVDDKTIAIMELLRQCDIETSAGEDEAISGGTEKITTEIKTARNKMVSDDDIWNAFMSLIKEPGRVNGTSSQVSIGQKWEDLVYFNEIKVRREIIKFLGIADPGLRGDKTHPVTIRLMTILADNGILMNRFENKEYGPARSLFSVKFYNQNDGREVGSWSAAFIVTPDSQVPTLSSLKSHVSRAVIIKPLMGTHAARNKSSGAALPAQAPRVVQRQPEDDGGAPSPFPSVPATQNEASGQPEQIPAQDIPDGVVEPAVDTIDGNAANPEIDSLATDASIVNGQNLEVVLTGDEEVALEEDAGSEMYAACDTHAEMAADEEKRKEYADARKMELRTEREKKLPGNQKAALTKIDATLDSGLRAFADTDTLANNAIAEAISMWQSGDNRFAGISNLGSKNPKNLYVRLDGINRLMPDHKWHLFVEKKLIEVKTNNDGQMLILLKLP